MRGNGYTQAFSLGCYVNAPLALREDACRSFISPHGWSDDRTHTQ